MSSEMILITGGTGLVGHALKKELPASRGEPEGVYLGSADFDLTREDSAIAMFEKYRPAILIHLAARVGGILDNMTHQADHLFQNAAINTNVIHQAYKFGVKKLICCGSNCAYPDTAARYPMREEQLYDGPPAATNFSYSYAKRLMEVQVASYRRQFGCNYFSVIPCGIYGPHDAVNGKKAHFIGALIGKMIAARKNNGRKIKLFGTGKPMRQLIYSSDVARIIVRLLKEYDGEGPVNIAPEENLSIRQIAELALRVTGNEGLELEFDGAAPDGQFRKDISGEKLRGIIGDFRFTPLAEGIKKTYDWMLSGAGKHE